MKPLKYIQCPEDTTTRFALPSENWNLTENFFEPMTTPKAKQMDAKTLEALKASIKHWQDMRKNWRSSSPIADNCPLCSLFNHDDANNCIRCPVRERTGMRYCADTPYCEAYYVHSKVGEGLVTVAEWRKAATYEIEFLKSLLPKT